jgi:hypothetical protein
VLPKRRGHPRRSAAKPCMNLLAYTAPEWYGHCHWRRSGQSPSRFGKYAFGALTREIACPSIHRSADRAHSMLTPTGILTVMSPCPRQHIPGVAPGLGFLDNPTHNRHAVDTYSAVITQRPRAGRSYNVPGLCLTLNLGSHSSPGYLKDATGSKLTVARLPTGR